MFVLPFVFFHYTLKDTKDNALLRINLAFTTVFVFLFCISAFGIVWYGIIMYFAFLLTIAIGTNVFNQTDDLQETSENLVKFGISGLFLIMVSIYLIRSAFPHALANLQSASFESYKAGQLNEEQGVFDSRPDYVSILANLNLKNPDALVKEVFSGIQNDSLKAIILNTLGSNPHIGNLQSLLSTIVGVSSTDLAAKIQTTQANAIEIQSEASDMLNTLYDRILYPKANETNTEGIYRIGTFLTYFIANNEHRYYEDNLVNSFDAYFYDKNPDVTIDRMKKIGLSYLLVDLNASTIDRDPRHQLTKRFEDLLLSFRSKKLSLIHTDSLCLQMALDESANGILKTDADYLRYAGVNSESYTDESGQTVTVSRTEKQFACYNHIVDLINSGKVDSTHYPYLQNIEQALQQSGAKTQEQITNILETYV